MGFWLEFKQEILVPVGEGIGNGLEIIAIGIGFCVVIVCIALLINWCYKKLKKGSD